ncbi:MAG: response regulator transcription factor [Cytophagales bacterium]|nr:response regulator transcription factor [Cytophagales bacterium]
MNVLIIEDEAPAASWLADLLLKYNGGICVLETLGSVEDAIRWFLNNPAPDLVLMDVHLSDGNGFRIFDAVQVHCPIIFTTAHQQYALQAFRVNSIDYLLKPVTFGRLAQALQKWQLWTDGTFPVPVRRPAPSTPLTPLPNVYKSRFLVRFGDRIQFKSAAEVAYFWADGKITYLVAGDGRRYIVDYTLEELEHLLDPHYFYRLSRKVLARIEAVKDIKAYPGGRLKVQLLPASEGEVVVSRERVPDFKGWLDK